MNLKVQLYDSSDNLIHTFFNQNVNAKEYTASYTIDKSIYGSVGDYTIILNGADAHSSQSHQLTLKVNPDTTAPIITLKGNNPQSITVGNSYVEAGATATDNIDGDLSSKITIDSSNVNINAVGSYIVSYSVSDNSGNTATATRTVNVISSGTDTTAPTITIQSPTSGSIYNTKNNFLNFIASDDNLNTCSYSIDNGATKVPTSCSSGILETISLIASEGTNTWIVYAYDVSGNTASASVTFTVNTSIVDITPPVITVTSPTDNGKINSRNLGVELTTDENATVTLSLDGRSAVTMDNSVDHIFTYVLNGLSNGNHTLTFTATDTSGNVATKTISFTVYKKSSSGGSGVIVNVPTSSSPTINPIAVPQGDVKILDDISLTKKVSFFQSIITQ